jgi:hypothetical protein
MIALVIIGVMAVTIVPALSVVLSDHRQNAAMMDALRLARKARNLAISSGVAHLIRYQSAGARGLGTIGLFAGMNSRCAQTPWAIAFAGSVPLRQGPIDTLDMSYYNPTALGAPPSLQDSGRFVIRLLMQTDSGAGPVTANEVQICYQPNQETYLRLATGAPMLRQMLTAQLLVMRTYESQTEGRDRKIMFPAGTTPWIDR